MFGNIASLIQLMIAALVLVALLVFSVVKIGQAFSALRQNPVRKNLSLLGWGTLAIAALLVSYIVCRYFEFAQIRPEWSFRELHYSVWVGLGWHKLYSDFEGIKVVIGLFAILYGAARMSRKIMFAPSIGYLVGYFLGDLIGWDTQNGYELTNNAWAFWMLIFLGFIVTSIVWQVKQNHRLASPELKA